MRLYGKGKIIMDHYFTNNEKLKSEIKEIKYSILDNSLVFYSDSGVFSKDKIDFGSDILIKSYLKSHNESLKILDLGCGYGVIGITLSILTNSSADMTDVNKRSIHLAKMNIKKHKCNAKAFYSDAYNDITDKYNIIITNPPVRVGKNKLLEILKGAKNHLLKNGELWFVIRKDQGGLTIKKLLESDYNIEIKNKLKGYLIFCAKNR